MKRKRFPYGLNLLKLKERIVNLLFWCAMLFVAYFAVLLFLFASFRIPSDSMEPTLISGDHVLVNKVIPGARIFNIFASAKGKEVSIYRLPGIRKIKHNDVIVFNDPYALHSDTMKMHILKYFVKRCIGLPGDTLSLRDGYYYASGVDFPLGNRSYEYKDLPFDQFFPGQRNKHLIFPGDSLWQWTEKDFGPLYIPRKGDVIELSPENIALYHKIIEWELQHSLSITFDKKAYLRGELLRSYQLQHDYYFVGGDNMESSLDSRYWGLLPDDYIVGKVFLIWKSQNLYTGEYYWNRFFRSVK